MRRLAFAALALLLAACTATTSVSVGSGGMGAAPGTAVSGAAIAGHAESISAAVPLLGLAIIGTTVYGARDAEPAPALDPTRPIQVRDCGEPIEDLSANLVCR